MSTMLLRNSVKQLYFKSCYQLLKIRNIQSHNEPAVIKSQIIFQKQQTIPANLSIIRCVTSKPIEIKEYETSRKYTWNWKLERVMGWSLAVTIPLAFVVESKELEMALSTAALMHTYWGCQSMCSDYLRSSVVGKVLPVVVRSAIVLLTLASIGGIFELIYEDIGLINMIKNFWSIRGQDYVPPKHLQKLELEQKQNIFRLFTRK